MAKLIAGGAFVKVIFTEGTTEHTLVLATNCSYDEDWRVQEANVIGWLGPISLDTQGYTCSITIGAFVGETVDENTLPNVGGQAGGSRKTLSELMPDRATIQEAGVGKKFDSISFINLTNDDTITFQECVVASNGHQVAANSYVNSSMRLLAKGRVFDVGTATPPA